MHKLYQQNKGYFYGIISSIQRYEGEDERGNLYRGSRTGSDRQINIYQAVYGASCAPEPPGRQKKAQTRDELPQSAAGKTIMTTEPKFIPKEAAELGRLRRGSGRRCGSVDCVGFMVEGAAGHTENGEERLVKTPGTIMRSRSPRRRKLVRER